MEEKVYGLKKGMKIFAWIMGIICIPLIVTIPGAILMIMLATRAKLVIRQDKMIATWIKTREYNWSELSGVSWGINKAGLIGALMGRPLHTHDKDGKKAPWGVMVNAYLNTEEILEEIEKRVELIK
jgi:hypothetical protein